MNWSPSERVVALLAVLALAAGAGALAGTTLGGGPGVPSGGDTDALGGSAGDADPPQTGGAGGSGGGCLLGCPEFSARALLGLVGVSLSPAVVAGLAVLVGLFAVAAGRRRATGSPPETGTDDDEVPDATTRSDRHSTAAVGVEETNAVYRAWARLAERVGGDRTLTPGERARRAVAAGLDRDRVGRLRRLFEHVRYGDRPVTDERAERARETAAALDLGEEASEEAREP